MADKVKMSSTSEYVDLRDPEYQAIVIIENEDGRMFPLTDENTNKSLLPIANRPLLAYQIDMLRQSGVAEVYITTPKEYEASINKFLREFVRFNISIELVVVERMQGSADALRAVADRIRGDFIVVMSDAISQFSLIDLVNLHRQSISDVSMILTTAPKESDDIDQEYIGLSNDGRVLLKTPAIELEENITIPKPWIFKASPFRLRNDLADVGIYLFSYWIVEFVVERKKLSSIRNDILPFLIKRQFQPTEYLFENIPALEHRKRALSVIEPWFTGPEYSSTTAATTTNADDLNAQTVLEKLKVYSNLKMDYLERKKLESQQHDQSTLSIDLVADNKNAKQFIKDDDSDDNDSTNGNKVDLGDLLRCYALVYESPNNATAASTASAGGKAIAADGTASTAYCLQRLTTITSYLNINKDLPQWQKNVPWGAISYLKKEMSVIATPTICEDKTITIKQCTIGSNCTIAAKCKLNNCVIMDGATIGENCTIQNSVIGEKAVIENNCNINECTVAKANRVAAGTKTKGETFADK